MKIATGDGNVALASPVHVYSHQVPLSAEEAPLIGRAYKLTSGPLSGYEALVAEQGCLTGYYTKTEALSSGNVLPEDGYAHALGGARKFDTTWHVYTAQPDSADWQRYHLATLKKLPSWVQWYFSDSVLLSYYQGGKPAKPPGHTTLYTLAEWLALEKKNVDSWAVATGKPFVINGLSADSMKALTPGVGMVENAFGSNKGSLPSAATWLKHYQLLLEAQSAGWTPWVYVKLFNQPAAVWDAWRQLMIPTMLLADQGSLLFELGPSEGGPPPWVTDEYLHPGYRPGIGKPTGGAFLNVSGVYTRQFEQGMVVVNPTASDTSLAVGGFTVSVKKQSGQVLKQQTTLTSIAL